MTGSEYVKAAMRTNDGKNTDRMIQAVTVNRENKKDIGGIVNACLGLSGEVGEFNDMVKKWIFHEKPLDEEHAKKEMGDVLWYVAETATAIGYDLETIMDMNIYKLLKRYPNGFSAERSQNRAKGDV